MRKKDRIKKTKARLLRRPFLFPFPSFRSIRFQGAYLYLSRVYTFVCPFRSCFSSNLTTVAVAIANLYTVPLSAVRTSTPHIRLLVLCIICIYPATESNKSNGNFNGLFRSQFRVHIVDMHSIDGDRVPSWIFRKVVAECDLISKQMFKLIKISTKTRQKQKNLTLNWFGARQKWKRKMWN